MYARRGHRATRTRRKRRHHLSRRFAHAVVVGEETRVSVRACDTREHVRVAVDGEAVELPASEPYMLEAGRRITLLPGVWHAFVPASDDCVIGEVSTANDDLHDNFFVAEAIGRFPGIEEDEPAQIKLISE